MTKANKKAAQEFAKFWENKGYEKGESQKFWNMLLRDILNVEKPETFIEYEDKVMMDKSTGFIDGYIPSSKVLLEQKSADKDLRKAVKQSDGSLLTPYQQAKRYIIDLPVSRHPKWVITCNFKEFNIYDMDNPKGEPEIIYLKDLPKEYYRLSFIVDSENVHLKKEMEISIKAGDIVGLLYDAFAKQYHDLTNKHSIESLNKLCVRIVFCLYAEDAGLFKYKNQFHDYLNKYSAREMRQALIDLFKVLDTEESKRGGLYLTEDALDFPYVNGALFSDENIEIPLITDEIRELLLSKASDNFDWSEISPTIFGAVFESTLNPETRRSGGMHYTSIENIHKVIDPLFLDELKKELEEIKQLKQLTAIRRRVTEYQNKLASLKFMDPAAGSGNFLTETYISLRKLENEALNLAYKDNMTLIDPVKVQISQFYGIEINDFAVSVAQTALWIAESQMKKATEDLFNINLEYLPLKSFTNIVEANALRIDWNDVIPTNELNYIMGNPPFVGHQWRDTEQQSDMDIVFNDLNTNYGKLDYVSAWYKKACDVMQKTKIKTAFVSTNSIVQGESVTTMWKPLFEKKHLEIIFAWQNFVWNSESLGKAHVHCVIIGFVCGKTDTQKTIYQKESIHNKVQNINGYLLDAPNIFIENRGKPLTAGMPKMTKGSQATDGSHLMLSEKERTELIRKHPQTKKFIRQIIGADDYINHKTRYCLWLKGVPPNEYVHIPEIIRRLEAVKHIRMRSPTASVKRDASIPMLFTQIRQPNTDYLVIPRISSFQRRYIPIGFVSKEIIANDKVMFIPQASLCLFGILISNVHMAWMRITAGRLKSDYSYTPAVYNNFPWCNPTEKQKAKIEQTAQAILDARAKYPDSSLAALYDELGMPPELRKAHQNNDRAVMEAYGFNWRTMTESECVAELMKMYQKLTEEKK